jgi:hypothetical protein
VVRQTVSIPGEILKTTVIFGLTFDELMVLAAIPLVLVVPAAMIDQIPLWVSLVIVAAGAVGVIAVVYKTPDGQSPVEWFPAYVDRHIKPTRYQLKPKDRTKYGQPRVKYLDVVHTAEAIREESGADDLDVDTMIAEIEYASRLEYPEWAKDTGETGVFSRLKEVLTR